MSSVKQISIVNERVSDFKLRLNTYLIVKKAGECLLLHCLLQMLN